MKRFFIMMLSLVLLSACDKPGDDNGGKDDGGGAASECVIPQTAQAGSEVIIQWDGFAQGADILLVSSEGKEYDMDVRSVTSSGLTFKVPANVPAGKYTVRLVQGGKEDIGEINITAAPMPITGLKVPAGAKQGSTVVIPGAGFESGCSVKFSGASDEDVVLEATMITSGVSVVIPEDMPVGEYKVYLIQNDMSWLISESFTVYEDMVMKTLRRIEYDSPYVGTAILRYAWDISYDDPLTLTVSQYVVETEVASLEAYDKYVCTDGRWSFELVEDGLEESNNMEMTYDRDVESGFPLTSDVLIYGDDEPTRFTWSYDADGFLTEIASPSRPFRSLEYSEGNLIRFRNTEFRYENTDLKNHPGAPDVVWGYMSLMEYNDPFVYFPYLLGWYDMGSALLPSVIAVPDPSGSGVIDNPLTYEFDEDGYVTSMSWGSNKIGYFFE